MKILAIDPGSSQSAWCELENCQPRRADKIGNDVLLSALRALDAHVWQPELVAIEMIASYGMAVGKEVFDTCLWVGRFIEATERAGAPWRLVYRKEVKLFRCETSRANDANIRAALIDRFGPGKEVAIGTKRAPGPLFGIKGDEWSALAVGLTAAGVPALAPIFKPSQPTASLNADPF